MKSGREFIGKVTTALSEKKVAGIVDPKVLSKEIAEKLATEPEHEVVDKALTAWKQGDKKAFEEAIASLESFGKAMAPSLRDAAVILPYSRAKIFTKGWGGEFQAHHILEVDMMGKLKLGAAEDAPAIILSEAEHKEITKALNEARANFQAKMGKDVETPQELWTIYKKVYGPYPTWLTAIGSYFP